MKRVLLWLITAVFTVVCSQAEDYPTTINLNLLKDAGGVTKSENFNSPVYMENNKNTLTYVKKIDLSGVSDIQVCYNSETYGKASTLALDGVYVTLEKSGSYLTVPAAAQKEVNVVIKLQKQADGTYSYQLKLAPIERTSTPKKVYGVGENMGGWNKDEDYQMYYIGDNTFIMRAEKLTGEFKFWQGDWSWNRGGAGTALGSKGDVEVTQGGGNMAFAANFTGSLKVYQSGDDWKFAWISDSCKEFDPNKDYYIDPSACDWFLNDVDKGTTVIRIWDGSQNITGEIITNGGKDYVKFRPTVWTDKILVKRTASNSTEAYNDGNKCEFSAPSDLFNCLHINSSFNGWTSWTEFKPQTGITKKNIYLKGVDGWTNNTPFVYDAAASEEGTKHVYKIDNITIPKDSHFRLGDQSGYNDVCLSLQNSNDTSVWWLNDAANTNGLPLHENSTAATLFSKGDFTGSLTITQTLGGWTLAWNGVFTPHVYDFYVRGNFEDADWTCSDKYKMIFDAQKSTETQKVYSCSVILGTDKQFKFGADDWNNLQLSLEQKNNYDDNSTASIANLSGDHRSLHKGSDCRNMKFSQPFTGTFTVYQKLDANNNEVWEFSWENVATPVEAREIYLRGLGVKENGAQDWSALEDYKFKLDEAKSTDTRKVYTWYGVIRPKVNFKIGDADWSNVQLSRASGTVNYNVTVKNTTNELKLSQNRNSGSGYTYFDYYFTGTVTVYQTAAGWTWQIKYDDNAIMPYTDLYLRGLGGEWNKCDEKLHFSYEPEFDSKGHLVGYIYELDNVKIAGGKDNQFKIGTKSLKANKKDWNLSLMLDANSFPGVEVDNEGTFCIPNSGDHKKLSTDTGNANMYFAEDVVDVDMILYQTENGWTMSWSSRKKIASEKYKVYLIASDFTNWNEDNQEGEREEFTYNEKDGRFYLELNHESNGTVTTTLTNRFGIEVEYLDGRKNKYYSVTKNDEGVALTRTGKHILNYYTEDFNDDYKKTKSMTLSKVALSDVYIIINPEDRDSSGNTVATISISGDEVDEIQSGKYTFYYQISRADLKNESKYKSNEETKEITQSIKEDDLRDIYYFMWGNNALKATEHAETTYLLASGKYPGQLLTKTAANAGKDNVDIYREEKVNGVNDSVWCANVSKLIEATDDEDNVIYYYEITVRIPKDQSAIGFIFCHDRKEKNTEDDPDAKTHNFLDYNFYPDKVYTWEGISSTPPVESMITKVYLHTTGGVVREYNGENLEDVESMPIAFNTNGDDGIYTLTVDKMLVKDNLGRFLIGITSEKNVEESDAAAAEERYATVFTNSGAISFFHNEYIPAYEGGEDGMVDIAETQPMFLTMPDEVYEAENVKFTFDRATSKLYVSAQVANGLAHYVIYFINDVQYNAPHIKVYEEDENGNIKKLYTAGINGVEMHQKGANLFSGGDLFYRHDLWVPVSVVRKDAKKIKRAQDFTSGESSDEGPTKIITPKNAHTFGPASALTFEFADEDGTTASKGDVNALGSTKFSNVPLVKGGVYGVSTATTTENSPLNKIYIVNAETGNVMGAPLKQKADGSYFFEGVIPLLDDGVTKFYLSTDVSYNDMGVGAPIGDTYGARNLTEDQVLTNVTNALTKYPYVFNGVMVKGSTNPWIIDKEKIRGVNPDLYPSTLETMPIYVEISPDGTKDISFGFSDNEDDFETVVEDIIEGVEDAPVMWFNLQGVRIAKPQPGLNIKVQGRRATKVYVR